MRRRDTPYSRLDQIRARRGDLVALVLTTLLLGLTVNVVGDALYDLVREPSCSVLWSLIIAIVATLLLTMFLVGLLYGRATTAPARIELWLPYHLPAGDRGAPRAVTLAARSSYQVTRHARRAWTRRYPQGAAQTRDWLARWREAQAAGTPFQQAALADHIALCQCLLLYALHRAGDEILGREARFGWWAVDLPAHPWHLDDLPAPWRDNPFVRADLGRHAAEWRLLLPHDISLAVTAPPGSAWPGWTLRHRRYGQVDLVWREQVAVAGPGHQVWQVLTQHLRLGERSELVILNARLEVQASFRRTLRPASDDFHRWAASLLARLEEALDWQYYMDKRPARILANLDRRLGWWPEDDSLVDAVARLERRLDELALSLLTERPGAEGGLETRSTAGGEGGLETMVGGEGEPETWPAEGDDD
ncbi:MAG: hypothetical protein JXM73_15975 [Anaerolineae bacterium]|nr:hypothetical protein [Anaerolineae bacterium]